MPAAPGTPETPAHTAPPWDCTGRVKDAKSLRSFSALCVFPPSCETNPVGGRPRRCGRLQPPITSRERRAQRGASHFSTRLQSPEAAGADKTNASTVSPMLVAVAGSSAYWVTLR